MQGINGGAARKSWVAAAALLVALAVTAGLLSPPASAKALHKELFSFPAETSSGVSFPPDGVYIDNSSQSTAGDVYVGDQEHLVVDRYSSKGAYDCQVTAHGSTSGTTVSPTECDSSTEGTPMGAFASTYGQGAVDPSNGNVWVPETNGEVVDEFGRKGAYLTQVTLPEGGKPFEVALDSSADLFVADISKKRIDEYEPSSAKWSVCATGTTGGPFGVVRAVAVDGDPASPAYGYIYVGAGEVIDVFNSNCQYQRQLTQGASGPLGPMADLTVDPASGYLYAIDNTSHVVDEFGPKAAEGFVGQIQLPNDGTPGGTAVNASSGDVYVSDEHDRVVDVFGPNIMVPDVKTLPASGMRPSEDAIEVTFNGEVNPGGAGVATCAFVYGTSAAALEGEDHLTAECEKAVPEGSSFVPVKTKVLLEPDVTYYFRLQASNQNGTNPGEASQDRSFITQGPGLRGEWASAVSAEAATLEATINPNGAPTSFFFQYGPTAAYGKETTPAAVGFDSGDVQVSQDISKLGADMSYHYRLVVVSELEPEKPFKFYGADQTFTTQRGGEELLLPDGRQWELVSPPDKHGGNILGPASPLAQGIYEAAVGGDAVTYLSDGATEGTAQGAAGYVQVLSERGPSGWRSEDIATPHGESPEVPGATKLVEDRFFSPSLSTVVVEPNGPFAPLQLCSASTCESAASPLATEQTVYLRHNTTCATEVDTCYEPLVTAAEGCQDVEAGTAFGGQVNFLAASPDGKHIVIEAPLAPGGKPQVVEWSGEAPCAKLSEPIGGVPGSGNNGRAPENPRGAVSEDGSRIFWQNGSSYNGSSYVEVTDLAKKETLQVGNGKALYETASANGASMFFTEPGKLYVCRIVEEAGKLACQLTDLAPNAGTIKNMIFASEDGSYVYFVATGVLTGEEQSPRGEVAVAGAPNLYMRHYDAATEKWEPPHLIAVISAADANQDFSGETEVERRPVRVSPNGRWMVFMAERSLTGYDNEDVTSKSPGERLDEEVFLYHAPSTSDAQGRLACVSCNPTSGRPTGMQATDTQLLHNPLNGGTWFSGVVPAWNDVGTNGSAIRQPRYLSNGGRVFFDSTEALVPQDVKAAIDVYEYESPKGPEAAASDICTTESSTYSKQDGGCIDLISSGESAQESAFLDASESGNDVFFLTRSKLVGKDRDTAYDVYDAHVCTSEAPCIAETPPEPLPCVDTESCREAPQPQPSVFGSLPSATFSGAGDLTPPTSKPTVKPKALTRAQKLKRALKACRKQKGRKKRAACVRQARKRYGAKSAHSASVNRRGWR
jgi:hypothetical protein